MTTTSDRIDALFDTGITDWIISDGEVRSAIAALRGDASIDATITALKSNGNLRNLFDEAGGNQGLMREAIAVVASKTTTSTAAARTVLNASLTHRSVQRHRVFPSFSGFPAMTFFDLCADLGKAARKHGFSQRVSVAGATASAPANPAAPFTGAGATGENPTNLSIGPVDQGLLAVGHADTVATYSNPIPGSLVSYLNGLTPAERVAQARTLTRQKISSVFANVFDNDPPLRSRVMHAAGVLHRLEPELIAAFILAEQRDQSRNEDAKDYIGATSIMQGNTSIGLGQVVVSTARTNDLFQDLMSGPIRAGLSHNQIATLLASEEFNIFATARYIRQVADRGATMNIRSLPNTQARFPGINMSDYARHSRHWPTDNVKALASEYTSRAWDDRVSPGWAWFVDAGFQTIKKNGLAFP